MEEDDDIYQEVDNIYDAPSLRASTMTSSSVVMTSRGEESPAPLEEGSSPCRVYLLISVWLFIALINSSSVVTVIVYLFIKF